MIRGLGVVMIAACGRVHFDPRAVDGDAIAIDAPFATGPFGQPQPIDLLGQAEDCALTGDMLELFFASGRSSNEELWYATRPAIGMPFGAPSLVPGVNSTATEATPEISRDGLTLWLASDRPGSTGVDVWIAQRSTRTSAWSQPVLVPELNTAQNDYPSAAGGDRHMVIQTDRTGTAAEDLYLSSRPDLTSPWSLPVPITEVNSASSEYNGALDASARVLLFASSRPGGEGSYDLYVSTRPDLAAAWSLPQPIAELNTSSDDSDPWISSDGHDIYFASSRGGTLVLYHATRGRAPNRVRRPRRFSPICAATAPIATA